MNSPTRYSPEVRDRAVRLVLEHQGEHDSQWSAITSVASKLGCTAETLRKWVRQAERDRGSLRSLRLRLARFCHPDGPHREGDPESGIGSCPRSICQWQAGHGQPTDPPHQSGQFYLLPTAEPPDLDNEGVNGHDSSPSGAPGWGSIWPSPARHHSLPPCCDLDHASLARVARGDASGQTLRPSRA